MGVEGCLEGWHRAGTEFCAWAPEASPGPPPPHQARVHPTNGIQALGGQTRLPPAPASKQASPWEGAL